MNVKKIWFGDISELSQTKLKKNDFETIEQILSESIKYQKYNPNNLQIKDEAPRILFLSVARKKIIANVFYHGDKGVQNCLENLLIQFWKEFADANIEDLIVKLDIVTQVTTINDCNEDTKVPLDWGLDGIAFDHECNLAILPEQIAYNYLINNKGEFLINRIYYYLGNNPFESTKWFQVLRSKEFRIYLFRTEGYQFENSKLNPLYRGQKLYNKFDKDNLHKSINLAANYLANAVLPSGRFDYEFAVDANRSLRDYNLLRHAGTAFSMIEYYLAFSDRSILPSVERAMHFMTRFFVSGIENPNTTCLLESGSIKLGGNGLAALAISKYVEVTKDQKFIVYLKKICQWILEQMNDDGSFKGHVQYYPKGRYKNMISEYYPGEVIYGLMESYKILADENLAEAAFKIAKWLINVRDISTPADKLPHDHWLLYGLNELYRQRQDFQFVEHSIKICSAITESQNLSVKYPDYHGSYYKGDPRSTPAATRSEGLLAAYKLVSEFGNDKKTADIILECAKRTICFQLRTQYTDINTIYLQYPEKALGGFRTSINNHEIRIDYVQHNLSSLISMYKILN
ncbi:MAG: hypothetical protein J0L79_00570 [Rickettsiales bacterium]|nr:hypothetical protein [Rickettsiales bacterium]MCA0254867.1 hypothetical protein [Pseudomonadota bacterium]